MRLALALGILLLPVAASAAPAKLPSGAGEIRLVEIDARTTEKSLVENMIPAAKDQPMETVLYDLDGDNSPEVLARLKGKGMCDKGGNTCRTLVLRKQAAGWTLVFDQPSQRIEARAPGYGAMRDLVVDGRETYAFSPNGYRLDFVSSGKLVETKPAPANFVTSLAAQFGVGAERLSLKGKGTSFKVASIEARAGEQMLFARMEGPGACGTVLGCPWRLLKVENGAYAVKGQGFATQKVSLLPVARDGWHDIAVQTPRGVTIYGWSGSRYAVAESRKEGSSR